MGFKRKRDSFSIPSDSSSPASSTSSWLHSDDYLISRTMKRHRDDRPADNTVYAQTMQILYDAQREQPDRHSAPPSAPPPLRRAISAMPMSGRGPMYTHRNNTLHSFWHIQSEAPQSGASTPMDLDESISGPQCQDCDRMIPCEGAMDLDGQDSACGVCQRVVCNLCAVSGDVRVCLVCVR
ncbi:hypothetical protein K470DRAFT_255014 [Piedraia hortae CBS 480.64]|uniref:Uncharacterized protein n=1 Tax=Piedraia hortae CBS 480.64 TaxID=1314780 RepID=A0A6A7C8D6_9PEZI|nr:hypothetical protein K470DRAFT_255014 [Piedraia hortae CBS 480.64]